MKTRRQIIQLIPAAGAALAAGHALAQAAIDPKDPLAVSLGYAPDATKVDKAKYPKYAAGQTCGSCALYQGKAGAATGVCGALGGKLVAAKGWCSAYAKKA